MKPVLTTRRFPVVLMVRFVATERVSQAGKDVVMELPMIQVRMVVAMV
jgi:hypothetical protein